MQGPTALVLELNICHAKDQRVKVSETTDSVAVTITAKNPGGGDQKACADGVLVKLKEPLGDRTVVVGPSRREVFVRDRA